MKIKLGVLIADMRASCVRPLDGTPTLLRADAVDGKCHSLSGKISASGRACFTITITDGVLTTAYDTGSYRQAQRWYNRMLSGRYPRL